MQNRYSLIITIVLCALFVQAQEPAPESSWESDPLDVLETPQPEEVVQPSIPEFTEVPLPKKETAPVDNTPNEPSLVESVPAPSAPATSFVGSEPDYSRESEFHRIYKTYNAEPTPEEMWGKAVSSRGSEIYQVQRGDTLSGISTTLFGDLHFWPKLWSLNQGRILNPHEISPGMAVQFFPGSMDDMPTLGLATLADASAISISDVNIPRAKKRSPLLKAIPQSLPVYEVRTDGPRSDNAELTLDIKRHIFQLGMEYLEYYIGDTPVAGSGVVTGTEMGMITAGDYQYIFVRLDDNTAKEFVVQKNITRLEDPRRKERFGYMIEIQGQIEVLEKVNDQANIYRAIVKKTIQPIEVGAVLTPGKLSMLDPSPGTVSSGGSATIMGGQFDRKRALFGSNSLVFLSAGSSQGLQLGQSLAIRADERLRNKTVGAVMNDRIVGHLKIVRLSDNFATGYVTKATDNIIIGDYVGPLASTATSSFEEDLEPAPSKSSDDVIPDPGSEDVDLEL